MEPTKISRKLGKLSLPIDSELIVRESPVVIQRNIEAILAGSRSAHPALQDSALNVLEFTVRQGLYHPLEVSLT